MGPSNYEMGICDLCLGMDQDGYSDGLCGHCGFCDSCCSCTEEEYFNDIFPDYDDAVAVEELDIARRERKFSYPMMVIANLLLSALLFFGFFAIFGALYEHQFGVYILSLIFGFLIGDSFIRLIFAFHRE